MIKDDEEAAMCEVYKKGLKYAQSFYLRNIRKIKPFEVTGELGIFENETTKKEIIFI